MGETTESPLDHVDDEMWFRNMEEVFRQTRMTRQDRVERGVNTYYSLNSHQVGEFDELMEFLRTPSREHRALDPDTLLDQVWVFAMPRVRFLRYADRIGLSPSDLGRLLEDLHDIRVENALSLEGIAGSPWENPDRFAMVRIIVPPSVRANHCQVDSRLRNFARRLREECSRNGYCFMHREYIFAVCRPSSPDDLLQQLRSMGFRFHEVAPDQYEVWYHGNPNDPYFDIHSPTPNLRHRANRQPVEISRSNPWADLARLAVPLQPMMAPSAQVFYADLVYNDERPRGRVTVPIEEYCFEFEER